VLLSLFACEREPIPISGAAPVKFDLAGLKVSPAKVVKVLDGDTVLISGGERLRYIGMDTPETSHPLRPVEFMGLEAKEFNRDLVEGKKVYLEYDAQKRDKYDRLLAYIFLEDGTFVNAELVRMGYAQLMTIPPDVKYTDLFRKLGREAIEKGRGLWGETEMIELDEAADHLGKVKKVRCKITSAFDNGKAINLNTGKDRGTDFTVTIFHGALGNFPFDPVVYYKGKDIEVLGNIHEYGGPSIIVGDPAQIRVINQEG